jgi:feruloyl esterase
MGQAPTYSYFVGCSDGGREALQEAQRYPNDFNGIIAGSPVNDQVGEFGASYLLQHAGDAHRTADERRSGRLHPRKQAASAHQRGTGAMRRQRTAAWPATSFLNDPRQCKFDPSLVQCATGQDPNTCLTPAQVQAAQKLYAGPKDHVTLLFPGLEPGGEAPTGRLEQLGHRLFARIARQPIRPRSSVSHVPSCRM